MIENPTWRAVSLEGWSLKTLKIWCCAAAVSAPACLHPNQSAWFPCCLLCLWLRLQLMHLGDSRWWLKWLVLQRSHGRFGWSPVLLAPWLSAGDYGSFGVEPADGLSLSLFHCFSKSMKIKNKQKVESNEDGGQSVMIRTLRIPKYLKPFKLSHNVHVWSVWILVFDIFWILLLLFLMNLSLSISLYLYLSI